MNFFRQDLDREQLIELLREVGGLLDAQRLQADIHVVGGAAMAIVFDARRTTKDIDVAIRRNGDEFFDAVKEVAHRHGLPEDWVNTRASAFMPNEQDQASTELNFPGLRLAVASPEHLIAMKLRSLRRRDLDDLEVLFRHCGITTPEQAAEIHNRLFSDTDIGYTDADEALYAAQTVFDRAQRAGRPLP